MPSYSNRTAKSDSIPAEQDVLQDIGAFEEEEGRTEKLSRTVEEEACNECAARHAVAEEMHQLWLAPRQTMRLISRTVPNPHVMQQFIYNIIVNRSHCQARSSRVRTEALRPHTAFGMSITSFVDTMRMEAKSFKNIATLLKQFFSIRIDVATLQRIGRWVEHKLMPQYRAG